MRARADLALPTLTVLGMLVLSGGSGTLERDPSPQQASWNELWWDASSVPRPLDSSWSDGDHDGIPDAWEASPSVDWGWPRPQTGRTDLLVEFIHVTGPDSGRYTLDFTPAYEAVAGLFAREGAIHVAWTETHVALPAEPRPGFLGADDESLLHGVLASAWASDNPFVTSVVMMPQLHQDGPTITRGAAFIQGMLAMVDYGAHTDVSFQAETTGGSEPAGQRELILSPVMESLVLARAAGELHRAGFADGGKAADGRFFLEAASGVGGIKPTTLVWMPSWFHEGIEGQSEDGTHTQWSAVSTSVRQQELAATIVHELGHTFGLCHAHLRSCNDGFPAGQRMDRDASTMSYASLPDTLHLLPYEWFQVQRALACPPERRAPPENATLEAVIAVRHGPGFRGEPFGRAC